MKGRKHKSALSIGIVTIHFGINYGSVLQAFALASYIAKCYGSKVTLINYIPERYSIKRRYFKTEKRINIVLKTFYLILVAPTQIIYQHIFRSFLRKYTPIGSKISNFEKLRKKYCQYDALIVGSDQVWNSDYNEKVDEIYYLSFSSNNQIKASYAASFGKESFSIDELANMKELLRNFNFISVRELGMIKILSDLGIENPQLVLDPIFLLTKYDWANLISNRSIKEKYLFMYILDGAETTNSIVEYGISIAKRKGLKTVLISFGHFWSYDRRVDYYLKRKSPFEFVELLYNSEFVVTNSFHGVAFSINFEKQFISFKRKIFNSRLESLINLLDLNDQLVSINDWDSNKNFGSINYELHQKKIDYYRSISSNYIECIVAEAKVKRNEHKY